MDSIDPNAALRQAAQFGDLAYVLVLLILIGAALAFVIVWKVVIPGHSEQRQSRLMVAREQAEYLKTSRANDTKYAAAFEQQTALLGNLSQGQDYVVRKVDKLDGDVSWIKKRLHKSDPNQSVIEE